MSQEKTPEIADLEAERAVLGAVLTVSIAESAREAVEGTGPLPPEAFTGAHRLIWEAMCALVADGQAVDHLTLADKLKARGTLVECGGPAYLIVLDQGVPMTHNLPSYVEILRDRMERRRILAATERARQQAMDLSAPPRRTAATAIEALGGDSERRGEEEPDIDIIELASQWDAYVTRLQRGTPTGLDDGVLLGTGIEQLDAIGEGLPSNLCVLLGLASMGKTALAAEIIMNWLKAGIPGGIIGLEDGTKWLTRRHLARHLGIPLMKVGRTLLHDHQQARLQDWMGWASDTYRKHLRIHRAGGLHATELLTIVKKWIGAGARWIWIDHGLRVDYGSADQRRYDLSIGKTLEALATLGERHGVAVCVNWHLNRTSDQEVKPDMKMAKESGYLEAAARWMLAVWEQKAKRPGMVLATALKVTEGPRDWTVALERDSECALVRSAGGYRVDFAAEEAEERQRAEEERKLRAANTKKRGLFGGGP